MVYEVKCENCGELIDFGGHDPEEKAVGSHSRIPEDAIKFDDKVFCKDCVKKFVTFGIGEVEDKLEFLEEEMEEVRDALGMEKHQ